MRVPRHFTCRVGPLLTRCFHRPVSSPSGRPSTCSETCGMPPASSPEVAPWDPQPSPRPRWSCRRSSKRCEPPRRAAVPAGTGTSEPRSRPSHAWHGLSAAETRHRRRRCRAIRPESPTCACRLQAMFPAAWGGPQPAAEGHQAATGCPAAADAVLASVFAGSPGGVLPMKCARSPSRAQTTRVDACCQSIFAVPRNCVRVDSHGPATWCEAAASNPQIGQFKSNGGVGNDERVLTTA